MDDLAKILQPFEDAARAMQGWTFEYEPTSLGEGLPWDYSSSASNLLRDSRKVLDLGTGGGETFLDLIRSGNLDCVATEEWHRNAPIASETLNEVASVVRCSSIQLPLGSSIFDVVLSKHEEIDPNEVARVLKPGGVFLTQQVVFDYLLELREFFPDFAIREDFFPRYRREFANLCFDEKQAREYRYKIKFKELGHLVYELVAAPWTIPGFSVNSHLEGLEKLAETGKLNFTTGYCLLEVKKGI